MLEMKILLLEMELLLSEAASEGVTLLMETSAKAAAAALPFLQVLPTVVTAALLLV